MKLKTKVVLPQTEEKTTSVAATLSEKKTRENCTSSNSGFYTWLMTNNEEYLLEQLTAIMEKPVPSTLGELKEPTHVVPKGRTKGTKRSATAVEILEEKIKNEEKKAIKRQKSSKNTTSKTISAIPKIRLIVKEPQALPVEK